MIFYLTGPDTYRALEKLNALKEKFVREVDPTGLSLSEIDGSSLAAASVSAVFDTAPLFARRRFVVVRNLAKNKDKKIVELVQAQLAHHGKTSRDTSDENLVVFFEADEPTAKHALHVWLKSAAHTQQFSYLVGRQLEQWVATACKTAERPIDTTAVRLLIERVGSDTWSLHRAIERLSGYLEPGAAITASVIEELIRPSAEEEVFPLIDAILAGDLRRSAPMLVNYLGQGENVQALVALLETQLRTLIVLADNPRSAPQGVHPFVVKKLTPLARRYRRDEVHRAYERLAELDTELKTTSLDPTTLLLQFLHRLSPQAVR